MAKLQEAAVAQITEICQRHKNDKTPLMMILSDIQNEYGYIPLEVQEIVSEETGTISVAKESELIRDFTEDSLRKFLIKELVKDKQAQEIN